MKEKVIDSYLIPKNSEASKSLFFSFLALFSSSHLYIQLNILKTKPKDINLLYSLVPLTRILRFGGNTLKTIEWCQCIK